MANHKLRLLPLLVVVAAGVAALAFFAAVIIESLESGPYCTNAATEPDAGALRGHSSPPGTGKTPPDGKAPSHETAPAVTPSLPRSVSTEERLARPAPPSGGGPVRGRVIRPGGAPAAGAAVTFTPLFAPAGYRSLPTVRVRAEPDGAFEAALPFPGIFRIRAEASEGKARALREGVSPGASVNLLLEPPAAVRVHLANLAPGEAAEARLERRGPAGGEPIPASREKDDFDFPEVPPGSYVFAIRTDTSFLERPVESREGAAVSFTAAMPPPAPGGLAGRVEDSFGRAVAGAEVAARSFATGIHAGETETDSTGRFRLALPEGRYRLDVEAEGFAPRAVPMAETGVLHEVCLARCVLWTGRVTDPEGRPIGGATILVESFIPHLGEWRRRRLAVSEAGVFTWRSAKGFSERFHVAAPGFGPSCFAGVVPPAGGSSPAGAGSAGEAVLRPQEGGTAGGTGNGPGTGGELEPFVLYEKKLLLGGAVRIAGNGENLSGARVTLAPRSLPPESPFYREKSVKTDVSGLFEFRDAAPGPYRLFADAGGFVRTAKAIDLEEDTILVLSTATGRDLAGTVTGRAGRPLAGIALRLAAGGREFTVLTNEEGRFLLTGAPGGTVSLDVGGAVEAAIPAGGDAASPEKPATDNPGTGLSIRLPDGGTFTGRILGDSGEPLRFFQAAVILQRDDEEKIRPAWFAAGPNGEFRIPLPAKPEKVLFRKPGFRDISVPGADLEAEGQTYRLRGGGPVVLPWSGIG